ncbi:tetratricopeptide repeat protein [SAR202 cluster bacterium AD-804-J14_MRT_500m]|nr:tetratricopeptide repeat protein [SAR202 cluster bacterium AD-804-J14_MRT_500m]
MKRSKSIYGMLCGLIAVVSVVVLSAAACSSPDVAATVDARLAQERAIEATVEARIKEEAASQPTPTLVPTPTPAPIPTATPTPRVRPTWTPEPEPTATRARPTSTPRSTRTPTPRPISAYTHANSGENYLNLKLYELAIEAFSKAIDIDPDEAEYRYRRGVSQYELAVETITEYERTRHYNYAIDDFNAGIMLDVDGSWSFHKRRGITYYRLGEYEVAIDDLSKAIEFDSKDEYNYYWRGLAYKELDEHEVAINDFSKAIELSPNELAFINERGGSYYHIKSYQRALEDADTMISQNSSNPFWTVSAYNLKGLVYHTTGEYELAINSYSQAIELSPEHATIYSHRASAYEMLGLYSEQQADEDSACYYDSQYC